MQFESFRLGDVTVNFDRQRVPLSARQRSERPGNYSYYGAQGVIDHVNDYIFEGSYLLIAEDGDNLKTKRQNIAQIAQGRFWVNNHAHVLKTNEHCDLQYLYYHINSMDISRYITGSAQPKLNRPSLNSMTLQLPPLDEQKKISAVLGALDDKIELNRKLIKNLERQAEAIFEHHVAGNSARARAQASGWKNGTLSDIADYQDGRPLQQYRLQDHDEGIPILKVKELRQGFCDQGSERCSSCINPEYLVQDGDVVFSWSGTLLVDIWGGGRCGLNHTFFKVTSDRYDRWFYYLWTRHYLNRFMAIASDKATTAGHIRREDLSRAEVMIPPKQEYQELGTILNPLFERIIATRIESCKLKTIRDTLQPKLLAGALDLSRIAL